jgi:regulator of protease activity HflC (stomatin/prohibitin superfamily)
MQEEGEIEKRNEMEELEFEELLITPKPGQNMLILALVFGGAGALAFLGANGNPFINVLGGILVFIALNIWRGVKTLDLNEAILCLFLGEYVGTVKEPGFIWINPLFSCHNVSLKTQNLETSRSVVNDANGAPIVIQGVIVWKVNDTAAALFEVENYEHYIYIQCNSAIRELAAKYPYESDQEGVVSLRGSPE